MEGTGPSEPSPASLPAATDPSDPLWTAIRQRWRQQLPAVLSKNKHALVARTFDEDEVVAMVSTILSGQLTMSDRVREFEAVFAAYVPGNLSRCVWVVIASYRPMFLRSSEQRGCRRGFAKLNLT